MKFSVIVPVYKVENVLPRCIESILDQTVTDFELILIDDGSPDRSGEICDAYAAKDSRIRVIHQKNGGVSKARNAGLDIAQGEYIVFVDSDDWVDADYLEQFSLSSADMIIGGYQIEGHGIISPIIRQYDRQLFSGITHNVITFHFKQGLLNYIWTKAFSSSIIRKNHLRFDESLSLSEDTLFVIQYVFRCASIQQIESVGYHYVKYNHETLTGGVLLSTGSIHKIETSNLKIYQSLLEHMGDPAASVAVVKRLAPLYKNILSECINSPDCTRHFLKYLFSQRWFRKVLDYSDTFAADEDPKFRTLLKTKSPTLFWLYLRISRLKSKLHRSTTND